MNDEQRDTENQINEPSWIERFACITTPYGGETVGLSDEQAAEFDADPDEYAAQHFGLSKADYREWIRTRGSPLCGERTKSGSLCKQAIGPGQQEAKVWRVLHRQGCCHWHGGGGIDERAEAEAAKIAESENATSTEAMFAAALAEEMPDTRRTFVLSLQQFWRDRGFLSQRQLETMFEMFPDLWIPGFDLNAFRARREVANRAEKGRP